MAALVRQSLARAGRHHLQPVLGTTCVSKRDSHAQMAVRGQTANPAAYKRGTGGRSSFSGNVVTVFGATGFVGRYIVNQLGKIGCQVIIPYRCDSYDVKDLRLAGDLGQILFLPFHLRDEDSIRRSMEYSNVVVNLIGREFKTKNFTIEDANIDGAARIARLAKEVGVERLIHFSHLNAAPKLKRIYVKDGSAVLRSKYHGEMAVQDEFPDATIIRPADMYGNEDRFVSYYNSRWRKAGRDMPLWKKGRETIKMPIFVSDVAKAVAQCISSKETPGQVIDCAGPRAYYLNEIVEYFYRCTRRFNNKVVAVNPFFLAQVMYNPIISLQRPTITIDRLDMEHQSDELRSEMRIQDLNIPLTLLENRAKFECDPYRVGKHYEDAVGEFAEPEPPNFITS